MYSSPCIFIALEDSLGINYNSTVP
uniref:Uncharacterized protein n=1 Tax=Rhizophora mucronata TaxID=61149 RepID=A0A2P2INH0_RHIMU